MTRPHDHNATPTPEEDTAIAAEALDERDYTHAAAHLAPALAADPRNPVGLSLVDRLLKEAPDPLAAVSLEGQNLPYFGTVALRGLLLHRLGKSAEGAKLLLDVLSQRPECFAYLPWALEAFDGPGVAMTLTAKRATGYLGGLLESPAGQGELPNAQAVLAAFEPLLQAFFRSYPTDVMVHLAGSYLLRRSGNTAEAQAAAQRAEALAPNGLTAAACASTLRDAGKLEDAVAMFRRGVEREPEAVDVRLDLADTLLDMGRAEEAKREYEFVLERVPDHPWAVPSSGYCQYLLSKNPDVIHALRRFAAAQPENARAADLLCRCTPFEQWLPTPAEATLNILEAVSAKGTGLVRLATTALESPSVHLCLRMALGKDVHIDVPGPREPDATVPRGPVKHVLWKYDANLDPQPQGPAPSEDVLRAVASIVERPYDREAWWSAAHEIATRLRPESLTDVLRVMVHPPPAPKGIRLADWIHHVQFAAAFVAAHLSWKDLVDVARGPMDWTVEAAVVALARRGLEHAESQADVLKLFEELGTSIPRPGPASYEYALWCVLPWLPNAPEALKADAARNRAEIESFQSEPPSAPEEPAPRERLSPAEEAEARRIRAELDRKYAPAGSTRTERSGCLGMGLLVLAAIVAWIVLLRV